MNKPVVIYLYVFLALTVISCKRTGSVTGTIRNAQDNSPAPGVTMRISPGDGSSATFVSGEDGTYFAEFRYTRNENSRLEIMETPVDSTPEILVHFLNGNFYRRPDISKAWQPLLKTSNQTLDLLLMPAARLKINFENDLPEDANAIIVEGDDVNCRVQMAIITRSTPGHRGIYTAVPALDKFPIIIKIFKGNNRVEYRDTIKIEKFRKHTYTPALAF